MAAPSHKLTRHLLSRAPLQLPPAPLELPLERRGESGPLGARALMFGHLFGFWMLVAGGDLYG